MSDSTAKQTVGIHQQILNKFLDELRVDGVSESVTERLRVVVASDNVSDVELKKAMFADDKSV